MVMLTLLFWLLEAAITGPVLVQRSADRRRWTRMQPGNHSAGAWVRAVCSIGG